MASSRTQISPHLAGQLLHAELAAWRLCSFQLFAQFEPIACPVRFWRRTASSARYHCRERIACLPRSGFGYLWPCRGLSTERTCFELTPRSSIATTSWEGECSRIWRPRLFWFLDIKDVESSCGYLMALRRRRWRRSQAPWRALRYQMSCYHEQIWTASLVCYRGRLRHPWRLRQPLDLQRLSQLLVCLSFLSPSSTFDQMAEPRLRQQLTLFTFLDEPLACHLRSSQSGALQATSDLFALVWRSHHPSSSRSPLGQASS